MWTLGLALWMFDRDRAPIVDWLKTKFAKAPELAEANIAALNAGHAYGETVEIGAQVRQHHIAAAPAEPGLYRTVTGAESLSVGLVAGAKLAGLPMFFGGYPITPASADPPPPLAAEGIWHHHLPGGGRDRRDLRRDRRELRRAARGHLLVGAGDRAQDRGDRPCGDDRAAAGHRQFAARRPLDRASRPRPSRSDLYQAVYGRNGDAPMPVIAARSPADAFDCAIEACRIATRYMTPVMLLTDGYIANAAEPWKVPDMGGYAPFPVTLRTEQPPKGEGVMPYSPATTSSRGRGSSPARPGSSIASAGSRRRPGSGNIDYSPEAHAEMTRIRAAKVAGHRSIPDQDVCLGETSGQAGGGRLGLDLRPDPPGGAPRAPAGQDVTHIHIRHIAPMPKNMAVLLKGFEHILVPEMNTGQLKTVLRDQFLVDARPLNKVSGQPFQIAEIEAAIDGCRLMRAIPPRRAVNFVTFRGSR